MIELPAALFLLLAPFAGAQGHLDIASVDGRITVHADRVRLDRLLTHLDAVAGTESSVPAEVAAITLSLQFEGLPFDDAVKKVFEGLGLDYAMIGSDRIRVLGESGVSPVFRSGPPSIAADSGMSAGSAAGGDNPLQFEALRAAPSSHAPEAGFRRMPNALGMTPAAPGNPGMPGTAGLPGAPEPQPAIDPAAEAFTDGLSVSERMLREEAERAGSQLFGNTSPSIFESGPRPPDPGLPAGN